MAVDLRTVRRHPMAIMVSALLCGSAFIGETPAQSFPPTTNLASLDGVIGFRLDGSAANDLSGLSVSSAGDVNGDGIDDVVVGAYAADPVGSYSGSSYVVFGRRSDFPPAMELSELSGADGFRLDGTSVGDKSGFSVSSAGDFNGDGIDDLLIGAPRAYDGGSFSGSAYLVFGSRSAFGPVVSLASLDGTNGTRLDGGVLEHAGTWVSGAGDINGDGLDDIVIGAPGHRVDGEYTGASYVVFGKQTGLPASLALSSLDGNNGFGLIGSAGIQSAGRAVSGTGDVNADGIDDLLIGAPYSDLDGTNSGSSFVVFGSTGGFPPKMLLSDLDGSNGFRLAGVAEYDRSGHAVAGVGDVNGDGIADLIIGAPYGHPNQSGVGHNYVVFGRSGGFPPMIPLASLDGTNGFRLEGAAVGDATGGAVSAAGDINGDRIDDLVVGAPASWSNGWFATGSSFVLLGRNSGFPASIPLAQLAGQRGFRLDGVTFHDSSGSALSAAGDINDDGLGDIIIGAPGADPNGSRSGSTYIVFGRHSGPFFEGGFEAMPAPL